MRGSRDRAALWITLRTPIIMMVLASTAVPVELRSPAGNGFDFGIFPSDVVANVAGYVPVGIVLEELGLLPAVVLSLLLTTFCETSQIVMAYRDPSVIDIVANVLGAVIGIALNRRLKWRPPRFSLGPKKALLSAVLLATVLVVSWANWGGRINTRGSTSPGILEAHWKLDEQAGPVVLDSSGNAMSGRHRGNPSTAHGMRGSGLRFDGLKDYVDVENAALRLTGSLTITAWINSSSFPADDAVIVSHGQENGYQLDTTVDQGPRTVGFKLINSCGKLMMRYGTRRLATNTWYHVAGVYDSTARTLSVYVNGQLDNGPLVGVVTNSQRTSRGLLSIGRRPDLTGFGFSGVIDDVHIYSAALTSGEIEAVMKGEDVPTPLSVLNGNSTGPGNDSACAMVSDPADRNIPIAAAASGILAAIAAVGFWPEAGMLFPLGSSLGVGGLLLLLMQTSLPPLNNWLIPVTALVAGVSVIVSMRRKD